MNYLLSLKKVFVDIGEFLKCPRLLANRIYCLPALFF